MKKLVFIITVILACFVVCGAESICLMDFESYQGGNKNTGFDEVIGEYEPATGKDGGTAISYSKSGGGRLYKKLDKLYSNGLYHLSFSLSIEKEAEIYIRLTDSEYSNYSNGDNMFQSFFCDGEKVGYYNGTTGWVTNANTVNIVENQWNEVDMWLDLVERKAYYYLNGETVGNATISEKLESISGFWIVTSSKNDAELKLDNILVEKADINYAKTVSDMGETVPPCGFEPLAVTFESENTGMIFSDSDTVKIIADFQNREDDAVTASVVYEVFDRQKNLICSQKDEITVSPNGKLSKEIFPTVDLYDIYTLKVGVFNDGLPEKTVEREFSFVNLPQSVNADYGICSHTNKSNRTDVDLGMDVLKKTGVGFDREDFSWGDYETALGVYGLKGDRKEYFEKWLSYLEEKNIEPLLIWGGANPNAGVAWDEYIPKTEETRKALSLAAENFAREYKDRVTYYEFTNELNSISQDILSCEDYAKALEAFYDGIKKGNPDAFVLGHGVGGTDVLWQEKMLSLGGAEHCDGMGVHYYTRAPEKSFPDAINELKEMYRKNGWEHLEIWVTEAITSSSEEYNSPKQQGYYMVRNFLTNERHNLSEKFFVYQLQTEAEDEADNEEWFGIIDGWNKGNAYGAKPALLYLTNYFKQTENAVFEECQEKDGAYIYKFGKDTNDIVLVMCADEGVVPVSIYIGAEKGILKDGYGNETEIYSNNGVFTFGLTEDVAYFEVSGDAIIILDVPQIVTNMKSVVLTENDCAKFAFETEIDGEIVVSAKDNYSVSNMGDGRFCISVENGDISFEHFERNDYAGRDEYKDYVRFSLIKDGKRFAYFPVAIKYVKKCADIDIRITEFNADGSLTGEITVKSNCYDRNIYGTLGVEISQAEQSVFNPVYFDSLKPGEERKFTFNIPYEIAKGYFGCTAILNTKDGQEIFGYLGECPQSNLYKKPATIPVKQIKKADNETTFDGNLTDSEWNEYKLYEFGNKNSDFSGVYYVKWDEDFLYVAFKVKDDSHYQDELLSHIRNSDSFSVKIKPTYSQRHENCVCFALGENPATKLEWTYFDTDKESLGKCKFACTRNEKNKETVYETAIPWKTLYHGEIKRGDNMYLAFNACDKDEDEKTSKLYACWVSLTD